MAVAAVYLVTVLPNLENDPIAGGDEGWIISASAKLAEQNVFGTDLFGGFYGAEEHYYFNLPLHHIILAAAFDVFDPGLLQARLVSVLSGLVVLVLTFAFARKLAGPLAGVLAAALLVLLRLNLAPFSGLTLTDLGATVRYDLITVPYGLGAALVLMREPEEPRPGAVLLAGVLIGLAALTQFIGAFFALPLVLFVLTSAMTAARKLIVVLGLGVTALLPFVPYGYYISLDWQDFRGQARTVEQETDLLSPSFYVRQLQAEPDRYAIGLGLEQVPDSVSGLISRPSARFGLLIAGPAALLWVMARGLNDRCYRLLALLLISLMLQLALLESTKRFVYWVVVAPFFCAALASLLAAALRLRPRAWAGRLAPALAALVLAAFIVEGLAVAVQDVREAGDAPDYTQTGAEIEAALEPGATVLVDNRMWPALRGVSQRSLLLLFYHTNPRISKERTTDIPGALERIAPDYVLLTPLSREILARLTEEDTAAFERFLVERTEVTATLPASGYGPVEVHRVLR
jgi:4-amino-4-deoxy-L-arabinose transferase-like glycosyltransferase